MCVRTWFALAAHSGSIYYTRSIHICVVFDLDLMVVVQMVKNKASMTLSLCRRPYPQTEAWVLTFANIQINFEIAANVIRKFHINSSRAIKQEEPSLNVLPKTIIKKRIPPFLTSDHSRSISLLLLRFTNQGVWSDGRVGV